MLDSSLSLVSTLALLLAAYGLGYPVLYLHKGQTTPFEEAILATAVGLVLAGSALAAYGLAGLWSSDLITALTILLASFGLMTLARQYFVLTVPPIAWRKNPSGSLHSKNDPSTPSNILATPIVAKSASLQARWWSPGTSGRIYPEPEHGFSEFQSLGIGPWPLEEFAPATPPAQLEVAIDSPSVSSDSSPSGSSVPHAGYLSTKLGGLFEAPSATFPSKRTFWEVFRGYTIPFGATVVAATLVSALAPPTDPAALADQLAIAKQFLLTGRISYLSGIESAAGPRLTEMLYLWALVLDGPVSAQLLHWAMGLLLVAASVFLAREILDARAARWVGLSVLVVPGVMYQMTAPLADLAMALWTTLAAYLASRSFRKEESLGPVSLGIFLGAALATKSTGWIFVVSLAAVPAIAGQIGSMPFQRLLRAAGTIAAIAIALYTPWYLRLTAQSTEPLQSPRALHKTTAQLELPSNNPDTGHLHPISFSGVARSPSTSRDDAFPGQPSLLSKLIFLVASPWQVTMTPEQFGPEEYRLGLLPLALLPGLILIGTASRLRPWLIAGGVYWVLWFFVDGRSSGLFPLIPFVAIGSVAVLMQLPLAPRGARHALWGLFLGLSTLQGAWSIWQARHHLGVATGVESRQQYLAGHEPTWPAAQALALWPQGQVRLLSQEKSGAYFPCPTVRADLLGRIIPKAHLTDQPDALLRLLVERQFTHLFLVAPATPDSSENGSQPTGNPLELLAQESDHPLGGYRVLKLLDYRRVARDGIERYYRLLMIAPGEKP